MLEQIESFNMLSVIGTILESAIIIVFIIIKIITKIAKKKESENNYYISLNYMELVIKNKINEILKKNMEKLKVSYSKKIIEAFFLFLDKEKEKGQKHSAHQMADTFVTKPIKLFISNTIWSSISEWDFYTQLEFKSKTKSDNVSLDEYEKGRQYIIQEVRIKIINNIENNNLLIFDGSSQMEIIDICKDILNNDQEIANIIVKMSYEMFSIYESCSNADFLRKGIENGDFISNNEFIKIPKNKNKKNKKDPNINISFNL